MSFFMIPALSVIMLLVLAAASLPWIAAAENSHARQSRRSLFHKSAFQLTSVGLILQLVLFLALGADIFLDGRIARFCMGPLRLPLLLAVLLLGLAFVLSMLSLLLAKKAKQPGSQAAVVLSGMVAVTGAAILATLTWTFLRGAYLEPSILEHPAFSGLLRTLARSEKPVVIAMFAAVCVVLSLVAGLAFGLMWYVLRRNRDDFGRDYYQIVFQRLGKMEAAVSSLILLPLVLILFTVTGEFSLGRLPYLLPMEAGRTMLVLGVLSLALPMAAVCWQAFARSEYPMRRKFLLFAALFFLLVWFYAQLAKLWL